MKLNIIFATLAAAALTACSSDALVEEKAVSTEAITFNTYTGGVSRSADYYCNAVLPQQFSVWARIGGEAYFENKTFEYNGLSWAINDEVIFWPESYKTQVEFYAARNHGKMNWSLTSAPVIPDFAPAATADKQVDLIYAHTKAYRPQHGHATALNFRHALSQVVFKAQNLNKNIYVVISGVTVCNMPTSGSFTLPATELTDDNFVKTADSEGNNTTMLVGSGTWSLSSTLGQFTTTFEPVGIQQAGEQKVNLTSNTYTEKDDADGNIGYGKSLLLLPTLGATEPYDPKQGGVNGKNGTYFLIDALIYNIADGNGAPAGPNDVCIWGKKDGDSYSPKKIAIPFSADWKQGKKYIYNFRFTPQGNGGYDPENGNDVLVPIEFELTIDDFASATEIELN